MADIDLDGIKARAEAAAARAEKATAGPWTTEVGDYSGSNWLIGSLYLGTGWDGEDYTVHLTTDSVRASELDGDGAGADAAFIAAARSDVPALAADVLALLADRERLLGLLLDAYYQLDPIYLADGVTLHPGCVSTLHELYAELWPNGKRP